MPEFSEESLLALGPCPAPLQLDTPSNTRAQTPGTEHAAHEQSAHFPLGLASVSISRMKTGNSRVWLFVTPWTIAHQAVLSMEFSRQEYWSGLPFCSPGDLLNPGIEPRSPALQVDSLLLSHQGSQMILKWVAYSFCRRSSRPRNQARVSSIAGEFFISWVTREATWDTICQQWELSLFG